MERATALLSLSRLLFIGVYLYIMPGQILTTGAPLGYLRTGEREGELCKSKHGEHL